MKKKLFFWFIAGIIILASCAKDEITDPSMVTEKARHVKGPVTWLAPSGGDDTQAFVDAFAASTPGSVIQLAPGVFHVAYIELLGFNGCLKGSGRDKTFITPYDLIKVGPQADRNLLPTWWRIIGGDVTISDVTFKTGDGSLLEDVDAYYGKTLCCLIAVNNYNFYYQFDAPQPMNFSFINSNIIGGALDPDQAGWAGLDYNVLMNLWIGTDVYWPVEPVILTSGKYIISNSYFEHCGDGFEAFSLGGQAVLICDRSKTKDCVYGTYCTANFGAKIFLTNNVFTNSLWYDIYLEDNDYGILGDIPFPSNRCEYVITGNTFNVSPWISSLVLMDDRGIMNSDIYVPTLALIKNNNFKLAEGSTGISCMNAMDSQVRNNHFSGMAAKGVYVDGADVYNLLLYPPEYIGTGEAKNVLILGNNFNGLISTEADIVLGENSFDCTVVGNGKDDVIDLGTNNKIVGMKMVPGGNHAGPTIRDNFRMMPGMRHHSH